MNYYKELTIIGGKAGAVLCYDLVADFAEKVYFLENFCQKEEIQPRGEVFFLNGKIVDHAMNIENYFVATGDNFLRYKIINDMIAITGKFPINLCHSKSIISKTANLGHGNLVLSGAVIHTNAKIGNGCIINTNAVIEHDNQIGNYTQIAPGAVLCGYVNVGNFCSIWANATVVPHIKITDNTIIGAGAVVNKNIEEQNCLYAGIPAILKKRYK